MTDVIGPGSTIGILGAGQLGRMLALVARRMGYNVAVFGGNAESPAGQVADCARSDGFDDRHAVEAFAAACDVVTYEFENIPATTAEWIAERTQLSPGASLLRAAQNRFAEKSALRNIGLPTAEFRIVRSDAELTSAVRQLGGDVIVKSNTEGYDGKGQWSLKGNDNADGLWNSEQLSEAIVEQRVEFLCEVSIIGGRFANGDMRFFQPSINHHANHILDVSVIGDNILADAVSEEARRIAAAILDHFQVVGVLCVEMFLTPEGRLVVNEIAPRPHNSGHLTIEAYNCSQFELQLRTICSLPPVELVRKNASAAMANLLGQHLPKSWASADYSFLSQPDVCLHLYGKKGRQTNRKLGHITAIGPDAEARVRDARRRLAGVLTPE